MWKNFPLQPRFRPAGPHSRPHPAGTLPRPVRQDRAEDDAQAELERAERPADTRRALDELRAALRPSAAPSAQAPRSTPAAPAPRRVQRQPARLREAVRPARRPHAAR
ncbi:hypothetical protein ACWF95_39665 [Streptomyces vinaceus]